MTFRWCLGLFGSIGLLQAEPSAAVALVNAKCLGCHNPKVKQGGLDLSTREALLPSDALGRNSASLCSIR